MFSKLHLLLFVPLPVLAYCPNIDLTNYPYNTPSTICVDYIGEYCEATCGYGTGENVRVCVGFEASDKKGPYILTGKNCTPSGGSGGTASGATDTGGGTPSGGSASGGTTVGGIGATEGGGWYMDPDGHIKPFGFTSGLKETIVSSSNKIENSVSNFHRDFLNSYSSIPGFLGDIDLKLDSLATTNSLLQSADNSLVNLSDKVSDGFSAISSKLGGASSGAVTTNYSSKLDSLIDIQRQQLGKLYSIEALSSNIARSTLETRIEANKINSQQLAHDDYQDGILNDIKSLLSNSVSSGSGTGTGTGDGEGSGDVVGPAVPGEPGQGKSFWKTQYPGGLQTLFSNKMDEVKATALAGLLNNFQMTGLGNGSVSTVTFDFNFGPYANFGVYKFNDYLPDLSVIIRLLQFMVIFWALIGARSDIFGG